ncbi:hypothetical protein [Mycobacterium sp.]
MPSANAWLEQLPSWTWNAIADQWEEGFSRLLQYGSTTALGLLGKR